MNQGNVKLIKENCNIIHKEVINTKDLPNFVINEFKNDVIGNRKKFEDKLNEKITLLQNDNKNMLNSINTEKENLQLFYQKKDNEKENILQKTKEIMDKTLNDINKEILNLNTTYDKYF